MRALKKEGYIYTSFKYGEYAGYREERYYTDFTENSFAAFIKDFSEIKISRRGLGFDKPDREDSKKGNCAPDAPAEVYGHTGFTGTCAWVDPVNELVYVFLSNRIYPDVTNRKLIRLHIRERIQEAIYDAMKKK